MIKKVKIFLYLVKKQTKGNRGHFAFRRGGKQISVNFGLKNINGVAEFIRKEYLSDYQSEEIKYVGLNEADLNCLAKAIDPDFDPDYQSRPGLWLVKGQKINNGSNWYFFFEYNGEVVSEYFPDSKAGCKSVAEEILECYSNEFGENSIQYYGLDAVEIETISTNVKALFSAINTNTDIE